MAQHQEAIMHLERPMLFQQSAVRMRVKGIIRVVAIEQALHEDLLQAAIIHWKRVKPLLRCLSPSIVLTLRCPGGRSRTVPRQVRIQYPGAIYHVMSRGNRRQDIYLDDVDRQDFVKTLAEACQKSGWQIHAFCLMSNHYHLVLETPNANLVAGMAWLQSAYTIRLNHRHKLIGHVLSGRYKAQLVEGNDNGYLRSACDYVHLNPVRAGLLKAHERLLAYPWSSFGYYLAAPEHRPQWIRADRLLGEHGLQADTAEARQEFELRTEARRLEAGDEQALKSLRRGWCLGSQQFKQQKLEELDGQVGQHHFGQMRLEVAQAKAERIISEQLRQLGWQEGDLAARRKRDPGKVQMAVRLRQETTPSVKQIAARLHLGTPASASVCLLTAMDKTHATPLTQGRLCI